MADAEGEGVAEEILVRLDAEDVLRCKSVCKSWYSLISSPYFVKAHLKHNLDHRKSDCRISTIQAPSCQMVGSSHGLVCLLTGLLKFVVSNPSTREGRELKHLPEKYYNKSCWGFGYDSRTDDYKVVVGVERGECRVRFIGLTLKSNVWKFIADVNYVSSGYPRGVLHKGALHWFMENNLKKVILSYDLSLKGFKEIPPPDDKTFVYENIHTTFEYDKLYKLGVVEECLCVFRTCHLPCDSCVVTWVMKKENSWQLLPHERNKLHAGVRIKCHVPYHSWRLCDQNGVMYPRRDISLPIFVKSLVSLPKPHPNNTKRKRNNCG